MRFHLTGCERGYNPGRAERPAGIHLYPCRNDSKRRETERERDKYMRAARPCKRGDISRTLTRLYKRNNANGNTRGLAPFAGIVSGCVVVAYRAGLAPSILIPFSLFK